MTEARRWAAGEAFTHDGLRFRVRPGRKAPGDLRLDLLVDGPFWRPVGMWGLAVMVDFLYENEAHLYPPTRRCLGGEFVLDYLDHAARHGYASAGPPQRFGARS